MTVPIVFEDMALREEEERKRIKEVMKTLDDEGKKRIKAIQKRNFRMNEGLFIRVAQEVGLDGGHEGGKLPSQQAGPSATLEDNELAAAAVYGILLRDRKLPPGIDDPAFDRADADVNRRFARDLNSAHGEFKANRDRFEASLDLLRKEDVNSRKDLVEAETWARVVKTLSEKRVKPDDTYFRLETTNALNGVMGVGEGMRPSDVQIELPDLEALADVEILGDNLIAMQGIHFSATLEELRLFQVVEKLIELFQQGMLPLGRGPAGNLLYRYWKKSVERMTEIERRNLYARTFGFPGGDAQVEANREFSDLWMRFVSAVSAFNRQLTVDELLRADRARNPLSHSQEIVRKSGRDLAANLSLHGYGVAWFAATELQDTIKDAIEILNDAEVKNSYGARDMFQVIDQVASLELGGARNGIRYRTMANAGAVIIRWLANHARELASPAGLVILSPERTRVAHGAKPTTNPTDSDLVDACDQWLAVTGTSDDSVERYSQPSEGPSMTSRPVQIPAVARDLLESVGVATNGKTS
jgi:hypothetical protein